MKRKEDPTPVTNENLVEMITVLGAKPTWDRIAEQFTEQKKAAVRAAQNECWSDINRWRDAWDRAAGWGYALIVAGAIAGVAAGVVAINNRTAAHERQQMWVCQRGDSVACLEAIEENKIDPSRQRILTKAYELHTGHPLPSLNPNGTSVNGYDVTPNAGGVKIEKR